MTTIPDLTFGAVGAALIAAVISVVGLIIGKENKTSEFRQAWIDGLRGDVAKYVGFINVILGTVKLEGRAVENWKSSKEYISNLNESAALIRLRLNPVQESTIAVIACLDKIESQVNVRPEIDYDAINACERTLLSEAQRVLGTEWKRVKKGELIYRLARNLSIGLILLLFVAAISVLNKSESHEYEVVERSQWDAPNFNVPGTHTAVKYVLSHEAQTIYADCDYTSVKVLDPQSNCGLRPLRKYECRLGIKGDKALSDLVCKGADGRNVYLDVSKKSSAP